MDSKMMIAEKRRILWLRSVEASVDRVNYQFLVVLLNVNVVVAECSLHRKKFMCCGKISLVQ